MLRNLFILFALTLGLNSVQAQVNVTMENQTTDTWSITLGSTINPPNSVTVVLGPGDTYNNVHFLVSPASISAISSAGCQFSTSIALAQSNNIYPFNCGATKEIEVNETISNLIQFSGTLDVIFR